MSLDATRWAWSIKNIRPIQKLVLLSLADRAGEEHTAYPSLKRLTIDTGADRKTIVSALDALESANLIEFTGETKGNGVKVYQLIGVESREDKLTSTENGTSTKNGIGSSTKNGTATSTKNGTLNLPIKSTNKPTKSKCVLNVSFDDFWNLYDKKVGCKDKIAKKWEKLKDADRLAIMEHLPKYKAAQPNKKYRKDPSTYLNNESWNDEVIYADESLQPLESQSVADAPVLDDFSTPVVTKTDPKVLAMINQNLARRKGAIDGTL